MLIRALLALSLGTLTAGLVLGALRTPSPGGATVPPLAAGRARLLVAPAEHDLGRVEPGGQHELALPWRRQGAGPLRVLGTRTGCGCIGVSELPPLLAEAASGCLTLTLRIPAEPGPLDVPVRIVTDAAEPDDVLVLRVRAYVGTRAVVRPSWLDLGRRSPGAHVPATLEVHLPPGTPEALAWELVCWAGEVTPSPAARRGRVGPDLRLDSVLASRPGPCVGALRIATQAGELLVPLRAVIVAAQPSVPGP